jgi:hypothetical protein
MLELHARMDSEARTIVVSGLVDVMTMVQDMAEGAQEVADED